ncbi:unnamed protein product, partial [Protopolystoma xenopodis]
QQQQQQQQQHFQHCQSSACSLASSLTDYTLLASTAAQPADFFQHTMSQTPPTQPPHHQHSHTYPQTHTPTYLHQQQHHIVSPNHTEASASSLAPGQAHWLSALSAAAAASSAESAAAAAAAAVAASASASGALTEPGDVTTDMVDEAVAGRRTPNRLAGFSRTGDVVMSFLVNASADTCPVSSSSDTTSSKEIAGGWLLCTDLVEQRPEITFFASLFFAQTTMWTQS